MPGDYADGMTAASRSPALELVDLGQFKIDLARTLEQVQIPLAFYANDLVADLSAAHLFAACGSDARAHFFSRFAVRLSLPERLGSMRC
ncbi:MAG: hypothetical protein IT423_24755 [Pirellulaceae bacterium]|nr:hypothetical protein [Pirellulaceae bacterium]